MVRPESAKYSRKRGVLPMAESTGGYAGRDCTGVLMVCVETLLSGLRGGLVPERAQHGLRAEQSSRITGSVLPGTQIRSNGTALRLYFASSAVI